MRFFYNDEHRTVHPHVVFESSEGKILLNGTEPPLKAWRSYDIAGISELQVLQDRFRPDPGFHPDSGQYYRILCRV